MFRRLPEAVQATVAAKAAANLERFLQTMRDDKLSDGAIGTKSGLLRDSIDGAVEKNESKVNASVFVTGDVPYAVIQEYGAAAKAHVIEATGTRALAFAWAGKQAFLARVNHPGSVIPEHSYLRSTLNEMRDGIVADYSDAIAGSIIP